MVDFGPEETMLRWGRGGGAARTQTIDGSISAQFAVMGQRRHRAHKLHLQIRRCYLIAGIQEMCSVCGTTVNNIRYPIDAESQFHVL